MNTSLPNRPVGQSLEEANALSVPHNELPVRHEEPLLSGIFEDTKRFVSAYGDLFKYDIQEEVKGLKLAVVHGFAAMTSMVVALLLIGQAIAHGLHTWLDVPLAAGYLLAGILLGGATWLFTARSKSHAEDIEAPKASAELKKDAKWIQDRV